MKVNEIFESIQGEGRYAGHKVLFIRLSGCTRNCSFCDTKYHVNGKEMSVAKVARIIKKYNPEIVVWTGGEPMLQEEDIVAVQRDLSDKDIFPKFHIETNGDILPEYCYDYVCFSPKDIRTARNVSSFIKQYETDDINESDIKIVTDGLELNKESWKYATMLMPLTTYDEKKDKEIKHRVWDLCLKLNKKFCLRQHVEVWGKKKRI